MWTHIQQCEHTYIACEPAFLSPSLPPSPSLSLTLPLPLACQRHSLPPIVFFLPRQHAKTGCFGS
jgi:hypothetical protein